MFVIRSSAFQTWLGQQATKYYSNELGTKIEVEKIDLQDFRNMEIKGVYIEDLDGDTLIYAKSITADIKNYSIKKKFVDVKEIALNKSRVNIRSLREGGFNYDFVEDYFAAEDEDTTSSPWAVNIKNICLNSSILSYSDESEEPMESGFDYNFIRVFANAHVSDLVQEGENMRMKVHKLNLLDKSGFWVKNLTGELTVLPGGFQIDYMDLQTEHSHLIANQFSMKGKNRTWKDYDDFMENVKLQTFFKKGSHLNMQDLAYFSSDLIGSTMDLGLHGKIRGTAANLKAKDFTISPEDETSIRGNFDFGGLPDIDNTFLAFNIKEFNTSKRSLERIQLPPYNDSSYIELPDNLSYLGDIKINGSFMGYYNDFVAFATAKTDAGLIKSDIELKYSEEYENFHYTGHLEAHNFELGRVYADQGLSDFGLVDGKVQIDSAYGLDIENMFADLSGNINYLDFNGYRYKNLQIVDGVFEKDYFIGNLKLRDQNIALDYDGKIDFSQKLPRFDFVAHVNNAHLTELNFTESPMDAAVCAKITVDNLRGDNLDNITGDVRITDISYYDEGKEVDMMEVKMHMAYENKERLLELNSDIFDLKINGDFKFDNLQYSLAKMGHSIMPSLIDEAQFAGRTSDDKFNYLLTVWDVSPVAKMLETELSVMPGATLGGYYDSKYGLFELNVKGELVMFGNDYVKTFNANAKKLQDAMFVEITAEELLLDSNRLENCEVNIIPYEDLIEFDLGWHNDDDNEGKFYGSSAIYSPDNFDVFIHSADFRALGKTWEMQKSANGYLDPASVVYNADTLTIANVFLGNRTERLKIDGRISESLKDVLNVKIDSFMLENINPLIDMDGFNLSGLVNGTAKLSNLYDSPRFTSRIEVDTFSINNSYVGDVNFESLWNSIDNNITMVGSLVRSQFKTVDFRGKVFPYRKRDNLDFTVLFEDTDLGVINEFLPQDDITEFHAYTNGKIFVKGTPDDIKLTGAMNFEEGQFKFNYLNTRYRFEGDIEIQEDKIVLLDLPVYDEETYYLDLPANGTLHGELEHDNFSNLEFDVTVDYHDMMLMNTDYKQNPLFYGQAYASGTLNIFGYGDKINIGVVAKSDKGTVFNLPLYGADEAVLQDYVRFISHDSATTDEYKIDLEDITMTFALDVTDDALVRILFDPAIGDVMEGRAVGHLDMQINELGKFLMFGDLEVTQGEYLFTMYNVINKLFTIEPGGTIRWQSGDPYEAMVNLTTNYTTRASLSNLVSIEDEKYNKKQEVNCFMTLKNDLYNPDLSFDIKVPKGDQNVEAALNRVRGEQEELTKQFFSLMVINSFVSRQSSGYGSSALNATTADLLNNQLSNWLSQLSDEFDLGFNYSPGDALSQQELSLAFETQLLNDRLELSGNFGYMQGTSTSQSNTNLIGDFNVEYKINEDGTFRIRGFNETNDFDLTNTSQSRYTQGVGVYYTESFDKMKDVKLFKKIGNFFKRKKKNDTEETPEESEDSKSNDEATKED